MAVIHQPSGQVLAQRVVWARSLWARTRGLIGRRLGPGEVLALQPTNGIHMFFMAYPIDVIFIDRQGSILRIDRHLRPWIGMVPYVRGARTTLEFCAGALDRAEVSPGDHLVFTD